MLGRSDSRITRAAFGAVVAALLVAACGSTGNDTAAPVQSDAPTSTALTPEAPTTTNGPPVLLANTVNGHQIDVSALVGQDALLWFWAPW